MRVMNIRAKYDGSLIFLWRMIAKNDFNQTDSAGPFDILLHIVSRMFAELGVDVVIDHINLYSK